MPAAKEPPSMEDCQLEPIAIVGMACRLPGSIDSPSKLWNLVRERRSVQTHKVPKNRFNIDAHYHPDLARPGSFKSLGGYFLDGNLEDFDPTFFNMTPVEAMWLDPQQRRMLEVSYECLESAGVTLDQVSGTSTAVYVGSFTSDYQQISILEPDFRHNYAATGVDVGIISNRVGNTFNLNGPSFTINTACSSSVYALHNACHALRAGDCTAAIVGGVNLILTVDQQINTAKLGVLSPTSTCHTFDASADGYGRAEGAGALYIKKLSDAIRDGDVIRSVIRSSATNTNGKVPGCGITYPSETSQERVVRQAYERAGLDPNKTAYAECHGTGTPVGDPIEARAISRALNDTREEPLILGAVKANIGHSEAASGIFATMKVALALENGIIPGVCGLKNLNPAIKPDEWNIRINTDNLTWPDESSRRASISSFGFGGANAHLILENIEALYPSYEHGKPKAEARYTYNIERPFLLTMSAHDKNTLQRNIEAHKAVAEAYHIPDFAYTINERRTRFKERGFTIMRDGAFAFDAADFKFGSTLSNPVKLGFVFTGQGAQWPQMGLEAMQAFPSFARTIDALDEVLQRVSDPKPQWTLRQILEAAKDTSRIGDPEISQPACSAVQIAIVDLFSSWGINPSVTIGHSSGEIGAAYAAGRLSAPEAIIAAYFRGFAVKSAAPVGTMLAVGVGASEVIQHIPSAVAEAITVACENAPNSVTLSGTSEDILEVKKQLDEAGIFARELHTSKAYHSPHMNSVAPLYSELYSKAANAFSDADYAWRRPSAVMISSVTATVHTEPDVTISYWCDNLRGRVLFDPAMKVLGSSEEFADVTTLVEIGPHSALGGPIKSICSTHGFSHLAYVASLIRDVDSANALLTTAGQLYCQGLNLNWKAVNALPDDANAGMQKGPRYLPDLPSYQWNYERTYWFEPRFSAESRQRKHMRHDILGSRIVGLSNDGATWKNILRQGDVPWLKDHKLGDSVVFPGAGHFSLAIEAYLQLLDTTPEQLESVSMRDIKIKTALIVPDNDEGIEVHTRLNKMPAGDGVELYRFAIESITGDVWTVHTEGTIVQGYKEDRFGWPHELETLHQRTQSKRWYEAFNRVGFAYGPSFQTMGPLRSNGRERAAAAPVRIQRESGLMTQESRYMLHPSTIDGCLHVAIASVHKGDHKRMPWGVVPLDIEELNINLPSPSDCATDGDCLAWTDKAFDGRYFNANTCLRAPSGQHIMDIKNLKVVVYDAAIPQTSSTELRPMPYSQVSWLPDISTLTQEQAEEVLCGMPKAEAVAKLIQLLDHKNGVRDVLVLTDDLESILLQTLQTALSESSRFNVSIPDGFSAQSIPQQQEGAQVKHVKDDLELQAILDANPALVLIDDSIKPEDPRVDAVLAQSSQAKAPSVVVIQHEDSLAAYQTMGLPEAVFHAEVHGTTPTRISFIQMRRESADSAVADTEKTLLFGNGASDTLTLSIAADISTNGNTCTTFELGDKLDTADYDIIIVNDCTGVALENPSQTTFENIKKILTSGKRVIWLTKGVNRGDAIAGGMAQGFLRAVRNELISSDISLLDFDNNTDKNFMVAAVGTQLQKATGKVSDPDNEFWLQANGVLHIPRLMENSQLNADASSVKNTTLTLLELGSDLQGTVNDGTVIFSSSSSSKPPLSHGEVELQIDLAELTAADLKATTDYPRIVAGKVLRSAPDIDASIVGKTVVAYAQQCLSTKLRTNVFVKTPEDDASALVSALPSLARVVDAILHTAGARSGDHVFLLDADPAFITTTCALGAICGFKVTLPPRSPKQMYDVLRSASVPNIVISTSTAYVTEAWRSMLTGSRFVLSDVVFDEPLDGQPFIRGAQFLSAGIATAFDRDSHSIQRVLEASVDLYQHNVATLGRLPRVIDAGLLGDVEALLRDVAPPINAVLRYSYGVSQVMVQNKSDQLRLSSDSAYLLVGCLGGLGRSLTTYMLERGCKDFVFLSRSGADKAEAAAVVKGLEEAGASVEVFRADASNTQAVTAAVNSVKAQRPIRGVVHAAMVLQDGMFESMTLEKYKASVEPKMLGALNLHNALKDTALDFFVMTSSISAVIGNPGQSNYCAGNSYLDSLALYRRRHGLAASSIALPMVLDVGVVAENSEIEESLNRKGLYGIDEREMLAALDAGMRQGPPTATEGLDVGKAQILLGLEPAALAKAVKTADSVDVYWTADPRLTGVLADVAALNSGARSKDQKGGFSIDINATSETELIKTIGTHIMERCGRILMLPLETFDMQQHSIASYGVDSMIGVELRTWLFKEFGVEVGFQSLLNANTTFSSLSQIVIEHLRATV